LFTLYIDIQPVLLYNKYMNNHVLYDIMISELKDDYPIHRHSFSELVIILGGEAIHTTDLEEYPIYAGDAFVINGDIAHGFKNVNNISLCNIKYSHKILMEKSLELRRMSGFQALFVLEPYYREGKKFKNKLRLPMDKLCILEPILHSLLQEYKTQGEAYDAMAEFLFMQVAITLSREYKNVDSYSLRQILRLAEAVSFIENNYKEQIRLKELSEIAHLSSRQFLRVFKDNYGISPAKYIIQLKLEHARRLMFDSSINISEIAFLSGFSDTNYFSRQFKNKFNLSPKAFRINRI
jgi:AraC-like DNA-binding protein